MSGVPSHVCLLPSGRTLGGRYSIESVLGYGSTGVVYLAQRLSGGERVALKVVHRHLCGDPQVFKRFHREAEILKKLQGNNIVQLLESFEDDSLLVLALEYVQGQSLEALLKQRSSIPLDQAVEIILQVCAALGTAHAGGIVHRDLKPGNVLIQESSTDQPGLRVRVVDFGLGKVVHGDTFVTALTEQGMIFGTPEYMAPEQARGDEEIGPACDIYSAGVILYELAVGKVPFTGRTPLAAMTAHLVQELPPPRSSNPDRGISSGLEAVILRALAKDPKDRYPTAKAFAEALEAIRQERLVIAPRRADSHDGIATSDTDLHIEGPGFGHSPTLPGLEPVAVSPTVAGLELARTAEMDVVTSPKKNERWLWIVVAVVFAVAGVMIGVFFGIR